MTLLLDAPSDVVLLGDQEPRIRCVPKYTASSGPEVRELAARAGLILDPWEALVLDDALGERPDGNWAAFEVGLVVPRQNGKGSIVEARELGGLFLLNEPLILHTAHEVKTAGEAFLRIQGLIADNDEFSRRVKRWNRSHGEEGIELKATPTIIYGAGARRMRRSVSPRLRFLARSRVGGRGFTGRVVILDEAFELTEASMAALLPTMSAQPNPQLWYTSTPPDQLKDQNARVLARIRQRGKAKGRRLVFMEWSAGEREHLTRTELEALRSDRRAWAMANPAYGIRISEEFIESELSALGPRSFEVERLGIGDWPPADADAGWEVISEQDWRSLAELGSQIVGPVCFAADVTPDMSFGAIAAAGIRSDGRLHVEITSSDDGVDHRPKTGWMVDRLVALHDRWKPCGLVIDPSGAAGNLITDLEKAGFEIIAPDAPAPAGGKALVKPNAREMAQACGAFYRAVTDARSLRHLDQVPLSVAVAGAQKRPLGDAWAWARRASNVDISPLVAGTLACWGFAARGHLGEETAEPWGFYE